MTSSETLRVCSLESRRASEMKTLIEKQGAIATIAPSMKEVPLERNPAAFQFGEALLAGNFDAVVFLTGVGARALLETLETRFSRDALREAFARGQVIVRGPKPVVVLREYDIRIDHRAPEPNTWRELLTTLETNYQLSGMKLAVQEYGVPNQELNDALAARGAAVLSVPVYRWELPDDVGPLEQAIRRTCDGDFDVLLLTSAQQVRHALEVADRLRLREKWRDAARNCLIGSIGPTCSEALAEEGLQVDVEASPPKMGQLVRDAVEAARKRRRTQ